MVKFKRHFRIYLVNNHPAYIVDEEGNKFVFHRTSHKNKISNKSTFEIKENPIVGNFKPMYIAKRKQIANKGRFSKAKLPIKRNIDINFKFIDSDLLKKTPSKQIYKNRSTTSGSKSIKTKNK